MILCLNKGSVAKLVVVGSEFQILTTLSAKNWLRTPLLQAFVVRRLGYDRIELLFSSVLLRIRAAYYSSTDSNTSNRVRVPLLSEQLTENSRLFWTLGFYTVSQKMCKKCFCHKFVKCLPTLIIFGTQIAQRIGLCEVHSFSTSPN